MRIMQHLLSSLLRSEGKEIIPSGLRSHARVFLLTGAAILTTLLSTANTSFAGSATWLASPVTGDWNTAANWTAGGPPNGPSDTATFDVSTISRIFTSGDTEVNGIVFDAGVSAFTIDVTPHTGFSLTLTISGVGITNNSGITQNFTIGSLYEQGASTLRFTNNATAGNLTVFTGDAPPDAQRRTSSISFEDDSTGDGARVEVLVSGSLDIRFHNPPGVTIGSIEGGGDVKLGHNNLTVGGNDLTTTFSGQIHGSVGGLAYESGDWHAQAHRRRSL